MKKTLILFIRQFGFVVQFERLINIGSKVNRDNRQLFCV